MTQIVIVSSMKYETAKELKDLGFPHFWGTYFLPETPEEFKRNWVPTLSELITACGIDFFQLRQTDHDWMVLGNGTQYFGKTPEEAVARLWIALNTDVVIYCNEQEHKGTGFMFACCKGCKHNP